MIDDKVIRSTGVVTLQRFVGNLNVHGVFWIVEVNDVEIKDQDCRTRNKVT